MPVPFVEAQFADSGEPIRVMRLDVHRASFQHEVAIVRTHSDYAGAYPTGSPVRFSWGAFPNTRDTFFGYVHHDEPRADADGRNRRPETDIVCIGVTGVLGEDVSRSWLNTRLDLMVGDIAEDARLLFSAHTGDHVLENVTQAAESSWKFLTRRAQDEGKVLFGAGPTVALLDRSVVLNERGAHAIRINRTEALTVRGSVGELDIDGRSAVTREAYALGDRGLVGATSRSLPTDRAYLPDPQERRIVTGSVVEGAGGLERDVSVLQRDDQMLHDLTVKVSGVRIGVMPTGVVELRDFGRRYDGFWSVDSVKFRAFPATESSTEFRLVKASVNPRARAVRRGEQIPSTGVKRVMRVVEGKWVASFPSDTQKRNQTSLIPLRPAPHTFEDAPEPDQNGDGLVTALVEEFV
ncbi:MAG: hypothetical protein ABR616_03630 [Dermatophilaceae bacterium]